MAGLNPTSFAGRLAGALLFLMAVLTCVDITMRWLFTKTIPGLYEISGLVIAILIAMALASVFFRRRNVAMGVYSSLTGSSNGPNFVASTASATLLAIFAWQLLAKSQSLAAVGETTLVLRWPASPFWLVCALAMAFVLMAQLWLLVADAAKLFASTSKRGREMSSGLLPLVIALVTLGGFAILLEGRHVATPLALAGLSSLALYTLILVQVPIGVAMALVGVVGLIFYRNPVAAMVVTQNELSHSLSSMELASIPIFLLMGNFAVKAGLAKDIFQAAAAVFGRLRGGLAIATFIGCGGFGAISGSSIATTATIGHVALGEMRQRNYASTLSLGSIAAGGTLGALIPPSVVLIIYCVIIERPIADAFKAAIIPGLVALLLYCICVMVLVRIRPELAPPAKNLSRGEILGSVIGAWRPVILFSLVLGGLYGGVFTTSEAAAAGTILAFAFWLASGTVSWSRLGEVLEESIVTSASLYVIVIGASVFGAFLIQIGIARAVLEFVDPAVTPAWIILATLVVMYLILGSVFDTVAALLVTVPFVIPVIDALGYDLIWWGIVTLALVEIGMITPPVGMNVFVLKSVADVPLKDIFRGVYPFLVADAIRVFILIAFPAITLWLPSLRF